MKSRALFAVWLFSLAATAGARPSPAPAAAFTPPKLVRQDTQDKKKEQKPAPDASAVVGKWHLSVGVSSYGFTNRTLLELKGVEKSNKKLTGMLTGTLVGDVPVTGEFSKGKLKLSIMIDMGNFPIPIDFEGKLMDDGTLAGTALAGQAGAIEMQWSAQRVEER
jgi:hypothetical protein